jgi:hypothetical protein
MLDLLPRDTPTLGLLFYFLLFYLSFSFALRKISASIGDEKEDDVGGTVKGEGGKEKARVK